eukprot:scaffold51991_cov17-Prasinocladus_malaysianus.AAC.1
MNGSASLLSRFCKSHLSTAAMQLTKVRHNLYLGKVEATTAGATTERSRQPQLQAPMPCRALRSL